MAASQAVPAMMEARSVDVAMVVMEALTVVKWVVHPDSVLGSEALEIDSKVVIATDNDSDTFIDASVTRGWAASHSAIGTRTEVRCRFKESNPLAAAVEDLEGRRGGGERRRFCCFCCWCWLEESIRDFGGRECWREERRDPGV